MENTQKRRRIVWTQEEWNLIFNRVLEQRLAAKPDTPAHQHKALLSLEGENAITITEAREANMLALLPERHRDIRTTTGLYSPSMHEAFMHWKNGTGDATNSTASDEDFAIIMARSSGGMPEDCGREESARTRNRERHEWNDDHWQAICNELIRRHPITMNSSTLVGIKMKDIESAAHLVFPDETIPKFSVEFARQALLECVARAKTMQQKAEQMSPAEAFIQSLIGDVAKGLGPLMAGLESRIVERMRGEFSNMLKDAMQGIPRYERREGSERKLKVAIVGGYNHKEKLEESLISKFPKYQFILLGRDPHNFAEKIKHCDLVLCNTDGISHATARSVRNAASEEAFRQIEGGETSVIRCLENYQRTHAH